MAPNDAAPAPSDRGPLSRGGIAPQPLFAVGAVLLGSFLANFDSRLTSVGLPDLRGAFSLSFDEGAWLSTAAIGSQILVAPAVAWLATAFGLRRVLGIPSLVYAALSLIIPFVHDYPTLIALARIREREIDIARAHGRADQEDREVARLSGLLELLRQRALLVFALGVFLLQLANAAMLPLMAGVVTTKSSEWAPMLIAFCIVVPQAIVALASPSVGAVAQRWGRRPLLMLGFAALAIRGALFAVVHDPYVLVAVQIFDGVTAAVFAVMIPLTVADVAFGSGHFNLAQGIVGTATGIGASLSTVAAGFVSDRFSSATAFLGLSGVALAGLVLIALLMPETRQRVGRA